jgi:NADH:ubiquinone oxidoreductase subunit 6 (subunit J)
VPHTFHTRNLALTLRLPLLLVLDLVLIVISVLLNKCLIIVLLVIVIVLLVIVIVLLVVILLPGGGNGVLSRSLDMWCGVRRRVRGIVGTTIALVASTIVASTTTATRGPKMRKRSECQSRREPML